MKKKIFALLFVLIFTFSFFSVSTNAAKKNIYTNTLDLASVRQNISGDGYDWQNIEGTLELNNITIDTADEIGLKIPENAVITLKGTNYIKASNIAITCLSSATFQGSGSLTVVSDNIGIQSLSLNPDDNVRFRSDKVLINAGKTGIYSENATLVFSGKNTEINATDYAIKGEKIKFINGTFISNGNIYAAETLTVNAANITVCAPDKALYSERKIDISNVKISVGDTQSALTEAVSYNGEKCIEFISTVKTKNTGVLFGGNLPVFVDYIVFFIIILAIAAVITVSIYIKYKKNQKLKEKLK